MHFLKSRTFHIILGFSVSAGCIWWLYKTTEWGAVRIEMERANYFAIIPALFVLILHFYLRTLRWRYLLPVREKVPTIALFEAIALGNFGTFVLPLRAGEFIRPAMLAYQSSYRFAECFVSVIIERFFDLSIVLLSFGVMVLFVPGIPELAHQGAAALSLLAVAILVFMIIGTFFPELVLKVTSFFLKPLPQKIREGIEKFLKDFLAGASVLKSKGALVKVILLSLGIWVSCFAFYFVFFWIFHLKASFWTAAAVATILALAVAAPSAPGFIGVYQAAIVAAFALFSLPNEVAVAYAIVSHVFQFVLFVVYGPIILLRHDLKLHQIRSAPS